MRNSHRRIAGILVTTALALSVVACSSDDESGEGSDTTAAGGSELSGTLVGAGASSQEAAMNGWQAGFQEANPDVTVEYDPVGSGGGRDQFIAGGTDFAGSDSLLDDEEYQGTIERCEGDEGAIHLPHYISPVAVAFNLPGIDTLNMSPEVIAGIFAEEITNWNDDAIAEENPDAELPDLTINPVHRSDESGTSENFTDYLATVAGDVWTYGEVGTWPGDLGGEGGQGTSGVIQAVTASEGAIGYADASQVGDLGTVAVGVGDEFVEYSPEAAAKLVDVSTRIEGRSDADLGFELARDTEEPGVYPIALVSYHIICLTYPDQETADLVTAFMEYVGSEQGQQDAADAAGSAPISQETRDLINESLSQVSATN